MSDLLETVIEAHGGLERWNQLDRSQRDHVHLALDTRRPRHTAGVTAS